MRLLILSIPLIFLLSGCATTRTVVEGKNGIGEYTYTIPPGKTTGESPIVRVPLNDGKGGIMVLYETAFVARLPDNRYSITRKIGEGAESTGNFRLIPPAQAYGTSHISSSSGGSSSVFVHKDGAIQITRRIEVKINKKFHGTN